MVVVLDADWRRQALRGAVALLFGAMTLVWPGITLTVLVLLFGFFVLLDGVAMLIAAFEVEQPTFGTRAVLLLRALLSIGAGVITFAWPGITALALLYVIAFWAILTGGVEIFVAIRERREIPGVWLVILTGLVLIAWGALLLITPGAGALVITWLIGWFALLAGVLRLMLSWQLWKLRSEPDRPISPLAHA
jgi:uncharacterized membrane protein HdeD (DUF308 family)